MAKGGEFQVTGADELINFLHTLAPNIERRMLDQSVSAAVNQGFATPIKKNVRQVVKRRTGNLLKGVKVSKVPGSPPGNYRVFMAPPAYHAHLIEDGTVDQRPAVGKKARKKYRIAKFDDGNIRYITHTGGMRPRPFFKPSINDNKKKAGEILAEQLKKRIANYIIPMKPGMRRK